MSSSDGRAGACPGESSRDDLRAPLLAWYEAHRRDLPWRRIDDPYGVWISEAMLQQTRVEVVIPYWERFLERFPTVGDLAAADEDDVVAAWSGLGYYRRARALRTAAAEIVERHGGEFPRTRAEAEALTGVGPYTAGAVLSIAHGLAEAVVDGNVARVFARWFELQAPLGSSKLNRELWRRAEELVPPDDPGAWNQALMELGATLCTPRNPDCPACPVAHACAAHRGGRAAELPVPAPKRATVDVRLEIVLVERDGEVLVQRRARDAGRMAGMWELPTRELPGEAGDRSGLWPAEYVAGIREAEPLGEVGHGITHHRIRAAVRSGELAAGGDEAPAGSNGEELRWIPRAEVASLGLTGMARKVLTRLGTQGAPGAGSAGEGH